MDAGKGGGGREGVDEGMCMTSTECSTGGSFCVQQDLQVASILHKRKIYVVGMVGASTGSQYMWLKWQLYVFEYIYVVKEESFQHCVRWKGC